jgi:hypothetical protein
MRPAPLLLLVLLWACGVAPKGPAPDAVLSNEPALDTAQAYSTLLAGYIRERRERDRPVPDTLYVGRHPDFPRIELPESLEHTHIRVIAPEKAEMLKSDPRFLYLNIFGWVNGKSAEFQVVTFEQDLRHRPDGSEDLHRYLAIGPSGELVLDSVKR